MSGRDTASCLARPYASRRDPGRHARRHPARGRDAPACLAGVDHHRGGHAALDRRRSRTGRAGALRMGGGRRDPRLGDRRAKLVELRSARAGSWRSPSTGHTAEKGSARRWPRLPTSTSAGSGCAPRARGRSTSRARGHSPRGGASRRSPPRRCRSRSAHRRAPPDPRRRGARPFGGDGRPGPSTSWTWSSPATSRTRTTTRSSSRSGRPRSGRPADRRRREPGGARRRAARRPDDDPHRPAQRPRPEQPLRRPAAVPRARAGAPPQVPQPPSRRRARRDDRPHRQRRDERADAGGQQAARLRAVRPPSRVGAGCRYQRHGELDVRAEAGRANDAEGVRPAGSGSNEPLQ